MRINTLSLFFLTISCSFTFAQGTDQLDGYSKGKKIITDLGKIVNPNGIQENYQVEIGGIRQWVYVRGQNRNNPVILFVHGGPASPISPLVWMFQRPMEEYFTIVNFDQRASGKTYQDNDPDEIKNTIKIDNYAEDIIELTKFIEQRYKTRKVILIGHSWGTIIAMKAVLKRPELFLAYVGIGQVINVMDNERVSFDFAVARAKELKNDTALAELESIAPYPGSEPVTRERIIIARKWPQYYGGLRAFRSDFSYYFNGPFLSPEYDKKDIPAIDQGNMFTLGRILPEWLNVDFKNVKVFPIPVFMFMGRHDYTTPSELTEQWINRIKAPVKKGIWFENSSHLLPFEEPGKMLVSLLEYVRPLALKKS